jgi:hypothetical protein
VFLGHLRTWLDTAFNADLGGSSIRSNPVGHDGQVPTIFETDKMAVSALALDASEN